MHSLNKNSYLQSRTCGINPRIINRCVNRAVDFIHIDAHDLEPPFLRLASAQPGIPVQNIDVTRRPLAFGRLQVPKLMRELHHPDSIVVLQAVTSFSDILHDPEKGYEAIRLRVPDRMIDLVRHIREDIRERTLMCLTTLAGLADGRQAILRKKQMIENLMETLQDDSADVRMKLALCLEMIARYWLAADILVDNGFVEKLLDNLDDKSEIVAVHLQTLRWLMYCDGKHKALDFGGFDILLNLLENPFEDVLAGACACLTELTSVEKGKHLALQNKLLKKLKTLLSSEDEELQICAASALMFCTIKTKAKIKAAKLDFLPERLLELAKSPHNERRQLFCIKALTNICEHPLIREHVAYNYGEAIKNIQIKPRFTDIIAHKDILIKVVTWNPTLT